jgi:L-lactate dehydrogenase complex protein LldF
MQSTPSELFSLVSNSKIADKKSRNLLLRSIAKYEFLKQAAESQYQDHELAKQRAAAIKWKSIEYLDSYLIEFEANFIKSGGKVIWAQDSQDAIKEILAILKRINAKSIVRSKSVTAEEIGLKQALSKHQIECIHSDIGEYIQQLSEEPTFHPALPAIHKSKEEIAELFHEKYNLPKVSTPEAIVSYVRTLLHEKFITCEVGITGANYILADVGAIAISENQGNGILTAAKPKIHIVLVGIEKMLPSLLDLDLFWPLHATHSNGQKTGVYNTILTGPKQPDENDGPEEMYVILLDNGRSNIIEKESHRSSLSCIKCGACLNVCPVYQNIGGHAYGGDIGGPIGSITTPHLAGVKEYKHLTYASTLCGKCTNV